MGLLCARILILGARAGRLEISGAGDDPASLDRVASVSSSYPVDVKGSWNAAASSQRDFLAGELDQC